MVFAAPSAATTSAPELRVCSQNIHNYGFQHRDSKKADLQKKDTALIFRFVEARCDIIAVQEVMGKSEDEATRILKQLARALSTASGRSFEAYVAESTHVPMRNGYLVATDVGSVVGIKSFTHVNLPKLQPLGKTRRFIRSPLLLEFEAKPKTGSPPKRIVLITFHLKSKVDGWKDPTRTQFETTRMEMAQGVRDILDNEIKRIGQDTIGVILGDRNSEPDSASAAILEGELTLADFLSEQGCRVDSSLRAQCDKRPVRERSYAGLFAPWLKRRDSHGSGTFRFRGEQVYLDDILIETDDLWMVRDSGEEYSVGLVGTFGKGSDHKLLWVEINW